MSPKRKMLKRMLNSGKNFANPPAPIVLTQRVSPTDAINRIKTKKAEPMVKRLFRKNGLSFFTFQITLSVDSNARNILAAPHRNAMTPIIAMTMDVCFIAEMFFIISSMPIGNTCLRTGTILSIILSEEPSIKSEKETNPRMSGNRLNVVAWTRADASRGHRSALNFRYARDINQRGRFSIAYDTRFDRQQRQTQFLWCRDSFL